MPSGGGVGEGTDFPGGFPWMRLVDRIRYDQDTPRRASEKVAEPGMRAGNGFGAGSSNELQTRR